MLWLRTHNASSTYTQHHQNAKDKAPVGSCTNASCACSERNLPVHCYWPRRPRYTNSCPAFRSSRPNYPPATAAATETRLQTQQPVLLMHWLYSLIVIGSHLHTEATIATSSASGVRTEEQKIDKGSRHADCNQLHAAFS